jgi:hypothetical protein
LGIAGSGTLLVVSVASCSTSRPPAAESYLGGVDGGIIGDAGSGAPADGDDSGSPEGGGTALCDPAKSWGGGSRLALATPDLAHFLGVTPDGLTVAWRIAGGDLYVADREVRGGAFSTPVFANDYGGAPDYLSDDRLALTWEGRSLVGATDDGLGFAVMTRGDDGKWANGDAKPFDELKAQFARLSVAPSSPVLGSSGKTFFFLATAAGGTPALYESAWDAGNRVWLAATPVSNPELSSNDALHRRRPTGVSSDDRTLFYFDEIAGVERAAMRPAATGPFAAFVDVGAFPEATPLSQCDELMYQGTDASGSGIYTRRRTE